MDQNLSQTMDEDEIVEADTVKVKKVNVLMNITNNISTLRTALKLLVPEEDLSEYAVWLQNYKMVDDSYTLADDCLAQVEGLVQVDVEILIVKKQINIVDVIQPSEEILQLTKQEQQSNLDTEMDVAKHDTDDKLIFDDNLLAQTRVEDNMVVDSMVAPEATITKKPVKYMRINEIGKDKTPKFRLSSNNGNTQLWTFLLELLTDRKYRNIIEWVGNDGKFKLTDRHEVAKLWGERKQIKSKDSKMCYEHLSRSLRYYYEDNFLTKESCGTYVYRFLFNIKDTVGYEPQQLHDLVNNRPRNLRSRRYPDRFFPDMEQVDNPDEYINHND